MKNHIFIVEKVIQYIEKNLMKKIDLEDIAFAVHYSKYHLHRIFFRTVGLTIHSYSMRRRLTEAARSLVFSRRPIIDIAMIYGYGSQQAFSYVFKSMYKNSPHKYREEGEFYPLQLPYYLNENPYFLTSNDPNSRSQDILFAEMGDIDSWMSLVGLVVDGFPHLNEDDYRRNLSKSIDEKRALIMKDGETAVGTMVFSPDNGHIDFCGVHPQYRGQNVIRPFLDRARQGLVDKSRDISVTTFRSGDKADTGYREIYKSLGFVEDELLVEFGYPTQRFILDRQAEGGF